MRFKPEDEDAMDELWQLALASDAPSSGYGVARHFAALVAELCAQLVSGSPAHGAVEMASVIRGTFAIDASGQG